MSANQYHGVLLAMLLVVGALAGCSGDTSSPTATTTPMTTTIASGTQSPTATTTTTTTTAANSLPTEEDVQTASGKFTESRSTTPLSENKFIDTYNKIMESDGREIRTAWYTNVLPSGTVSVTYVADESNQQKRMKIFVDAYIELTNRTGGTDRDMKFVVQKTGGEEWYTWKLTDSLVRKYLTDRITKKELLKKVRATVETKG